MKEVARALDKDLIIQLQQQQIQKLLLQVKYLTDRVTDLENNQKKNSSNSSKPPSTDIGKISRTKSLRGSGVKKPGGQPGHKGSTLASSETPGLIPFRSPDGIHWSAMSKEPVITYGAFDSQNLAFWDVVHGEYRAYWRTFDKNVRGVRTATSGDFIHWGRPEDLHYDNSLSQQQLYTNQIKPYYRAPELFIGFPTRYIDRGWSASMRALPELQHREWRSGISPRLGTALTEALIMAGHDGVNFKRWNEAFLRPGIERPGSWTYGQQYIGWQMLETKSSLEGAPDEISLYATESYWSGNKSSKLRRYTIRLDGFVSVNAPMHGESWLLKR